MLIVLLDCSSSMNEPPEGDVPPAGAGIRKIDRAREVLDEHVARAHPQERVILFGFAGSAVELARGHSFHDLQSRIDAARLGSGTDIPVALAAAASAVRSEPADGPCTVIVITDGLLDGRPDEDLDSAVAELSPLVTCVKVSLIGASERGLKIAIRISRNAPVVLHPAMVPPMPKAAEPGEGGLPAPSGYAPPRSATLMEMWTVKMSAAVAPSAASRSRAVTAAMPTVKMPAGVAPPKSLGEGEKWKDLDLSEHLAVGREDVQEAVRQSRVMSAVEVPLELLEQPTPAPTPLRVPERQVARPQTPATAERPGVRTPPPAPVEVKQPKRPVVVLARHLETLERARLRREPSLGHAHDVEDVAVTVAHAPGVARGVWHPLDVFVHLASLEDEVARIVRAERGHGAARASRGARLRRGTTVRIEPRIEGAELDVEALEMRWRDDVQRAVFRIRPAAGATALRGSVDVYVKHAILCTVPIAIAVVDAPRPAEPAVTATGRMMDVVFVSYATEERPIVERVTHTYRELGITVLMDKDFLHAGDTTGEVLRSQIERADVFQLFWSTRSSQKPWVEREWRHALTLTGPAGRKGARFIRPLVWERRPPVWPPELEALQFSRLELAWLARAGARPGIFAAMCLAAVVAIAFALVAARG